MEFKNIGVHIRQDRVEFRFVMKYYTKPVKAREVPCNLFISVEQLREALQIFICNLRQVLR
jgi:hypothetical protein